MSRTGFTTTFLPNTKVPFTDSGMEYDPDFNSSREGKTGNRITYAAVTARSYHTDVINALFMDGSVRAVSNGISLNVWRALGTRDGGEMVAEGDLKLLGWRWLEQLGHEKPRRQHDQGHAPIQYGHKYAGGYAEDGVAQPARLRLLQCPTHSEETKDQGQWTQDYSDDRDEAKNSKVISAQGTQV